MPIKTTFRCAVLAIAAGLGTSAPRASPLVVNKDVRDATSQLQNVDYHCYRRHGRRYCRDTYEGYDDSSYDDYGYGPGVVIGMVGVTIITTMEASTTIAVLQAVDLADMRVTERTAAKCVELAATRGVQAMLRAARWVAVDAAEQLARNLVSADMCVRPGLPGLACGRPGM